MSDVPHEYLKSEYGLIFTFFDQSESAKNEIHLLGCYGVVVVVVSGHSPEVHSGPSQRRSQPVFACKPWIILFVL